MKPGPEEAADQQDGAAPASEDGSQESLDPGRLGLRPGDRIGPYTLTRALGAGGMAVVWEAERSDGSIDRRVALKLPRRQLWRFGEAGRFTRERHLLARLEHPNIARLYDAGVVPPGSPLEGVPFLVLEYVEGENLTTWCDQRQLDLRARLALFAQVLDAVQYAHSRLVLHRDLKPANILVTPEGRVRLLDFGIGKLLRDGDEVRTDDAVTRLTGKPYTPDYASPEQVRGEDLTTASDVYSLGVVLYHLLSGVPPYLAQDGALLHIEWAILDVEPAPPSQRAGAAAAERRGQTESSLRRELRGELDTIVLKALDKVPARRYATVAALAEDLRRQQAGEPVLARPHSWLYRVRKYAARNKVVAGSAVAIVLALGVGLGVATWQAQRAQRALAQAVELSDRNAAVNTFLGTVLGGSSLTGTLTVSQLLDQTEHTIDRQFPDDAATRAAMRAMVAQYYYDAGAYARASPLWTRARADAAASGQTDLIALTTCRGAASDVLNGRPAGALARVDTALHLTGLAAHERAVCLEASSEIRYEQGDLSGALQGARDALDTLATTGNRYPMEKAIETGWLASMWAVARRDDLAEALHRDALAQIRRLGRERDTQAVVVANNYAVLMQRTRPREAVATLGALREQFAQGGAGTTMPTYLLINYGLALLNAGDPREALQVTEDPVLRVDDREWSELRPQRELIRARAFSDLGQYPAAHQALEHAQVLLAAAPSLVAPPNSMNNVRARLAFREGHLKEARQIAESLLAGPNVGAISRANASRLMAEIELQEGNVVRAEQLARGSLKTSQDVQGNAPWSAETGRDWDLLGQVLEQRQDLSGARVAYGHAHEHYLHTLLPQAQQLADLDRKMAAGLAAQR